MAVCRTAIALLLELVLTEALLRYFRESNKGKMQRGNKLRLRCGAFCANTRTFNSNKETEEFSDD